MSSNPFSHNLIIRPEPSRLLAILLLGAHVLSAAVLVVLRVELWVLVLAATLILMSLTHTLRVHVLRRGAKAMRQLVLKPEGGWTVWDGTGRQWAATLRPDWFAHPKLVVLNLTLEQGGRRSLVLLPDSVPQEGMRRLIVYLRWYASASDTV